MLSDTAIAEQAIQQAQMLKASQAELAAVQQTQQETEEAHRERVADLRAQAQLAIGDLEGAHKQYRAEEARYTAILTSLQKRIADAEALLMKLTEVRTG